MTTFDSDLGMNINNIYRKQLEQRSQSEAAIRNTFIKAAKPVLRKQKVNSIRKSPNLLSRSGTVPSLRDDLSETRSKSKLY
jgi:2,3-bisphosphoglycerate-independent phosphoglycerate mutase